MLGWGLLGACLQFSWPIQLLVLNLYILPWAAECLAIACLTVGLSLENELNEGAYVHPPPPTNTHTHLSSCVETILPFGAYQM